MKQAIWAAAFLAILPAGPFSGAQEAPQKTEEPAIDFDRAYKLFQRRQVGEKLTVDEEVYVRRALEARQRIQGRPPVGPGGGGGGRDSRQLPPGEKTGFKPLDEMTADDRYLDQDGGLYGKGSNVPPPAHRAAAEKEAARIQPLDADGKPSDNGKIVLISISMSNATQEFSRFKQLADADPEKSRKLTIVDCAQGGQVMMAWANPDARPWGEALRRIESAGVTPAQVQVAWIKLANGGPRGSLEEHGRKLEKDTIAVLRNAKQKFPNLRIAYLGSRIYGGWSGGQLNPEPFAYEGAFAVRWVIQDQIGGAKELNYDPANGDIAAPLLLWGPYPWADGVTPRKSDGLTWQRDDMSGDGVHPTREGQTKVAKLLLEFFQRDETAKGWFLSAAGR